MLNELSTLFFVSFFFPIEFAADSKMLAFPQVAAVSCATSAASGARNHRCWRSTSGRIRTTVPSPAAIAISGTCLVQSKALGLETEADYGWLVLLAASKPKATSRSTWRANRTRRTTPPATVPRPPLPRNRAERRVPSLRAMTVRWTAAVSAGDPVYSSWCFS